MAPTYYRKIIRIRAEDSPNVRYALALKSQGLTPPMNKIIVPGVLPYDEYVKRRRMWDKVRQCIGLDAMFWEGAETLMYPPMWLNMAEAYAESLHGRARRAEAMGVDTGEGADNSCWSVIDKFGMLEQITKKTPDTNEIHGETLALMRKWNIPASRINFDRGGGGKQAADRLRAAGYMVTTTAFGESISTKIKPGKTLLSEKREVREEKYSYTNKRAELYGQFRVRLDPSENGGLTFSIPAIYPELRRQLSLMPLLYDEEGRIYMLPKNKKDPKSNKPTLRTILGCSPDEADSLVLAYDVMINAPKRKVGVAF